MWDRLQTCYLYDGRYEVWKKKRQFCNSGIWGLTSLRMILLYSMVVNQLCLRTSSSLQANLILCEWFLIIMKSVLAWQIYCTCRISCGVTSEKYSSWDSGKRNSYVRFPWVRDGGFMLISAYHRSLLFKVHLRVYFIISVDHFQEHKTIT